MPLKADSILSADRTPPSLQVPKLPRTDVESSPSPLLDDSASLNDDLMSLNSSANKTDRLRYLSSGISGESNSVRQSFESTSVWGRQGRVYPPGSEMHSGSMEFSPLGNNSVYELVMNTRRKNWLKRPTTDDIPPVILSKNTVPESWRQDTSTYVNQIKSEYEIFEHNNNLETVKGLGRLTLNDLGEPEGKSSKKGQSSEDDEFISQQQFNSLKGLPNFYFNEEFKLDDSRTFRKIVDDIDLGFDSLQSESQQERENSYQSMNERLTEYLDNIENLLIAEISKSSNSFFFALEDVDKIESKAAIVIEKLSVVSEKLKKIDQDRFQSQIAVVKKKIKRKNIERLEQGLLQAKLTTQLVSECKNLYKENKREDCLELIDRVENLLKGDDNNDKHIQELTKKWPYKLCNLASAPAFANVREYLTNITIEIGGAYSMDFCDILLEEIRSSYTPESEHFTNAVTSQLPKDPQKDADLANSIKGIIKKLIKCKELASAFQLYNERFIVELKNIIKDFLPKEPENDLDAAERSADSKNTGNGSKLSRLIRAQTTVDFQEMLQKIFLREIQALRRLSRHQKVLLDVALGNYADSSHQIGAGPEMIIQLDINPAIQEAVRIVQLRMGKIIAVRRDISAKLGYIHFLKLCSICFWFDRECESITGEFLTKYLRDVLTMQIKNFNAALNSQNAQTVRSAIDEEKWTPCIVEAEVQRDVNDIVSCIHMTPSSWTQLMDLGSEGNDGTNESTKNGGDPAIAPSKGYKKSVVVSDKTFVASNALLEAIGTIKRILVLSVNLPSAFLSTFEKMCCDVMGYFNSRAMASVSAGPDGNPSSKIGKNLSILGESLDCLAELAILVQTFYLRLSSNSKDFDALTPETYLQLLKTFQASSDKLYQAHAPPPLL
ncbi:LANO_0A03444g1_1 [Lachancea nothofagi CBS 11611]|uniref:LANO_0A03444g1_1 n=1 Tax=Lachancea nothofagi CBS 11611 TaxID=1266666 RepID=A0A1G4IPG8_9SACH|nr:LANO_0A03444g1_1 [Lachancea nothofagi CBS 11611]